MSRIPPSDHGEEYQKPFPSSWLHELLTNKKEVTSPDKEDKDQKSREVINREFLGGKDNSADAFLILLSTMLPGCSPLPPSLEAAHPRALIC